MSITWTRNKALLAVLLLMMAVLGRNVASQAEGLSNANLPNPDSYYKLVILKDYMPETGFQFIARDNAPYGSWIHWSLPHTWTIWQLHRGLMAFDVRKDSALLWAGGGLTIFSMLLLALFVALAVANAGSPLAAVVSGLVIASSPPLFGYGQLVQITHHIFMLVPVAAAAACFLRPNFQAGRLLDFLGGALLGFALWISPETMPLVLAFTALRAAICLQHVSSGPVWPVAVGLMLMVLTGWAIDPPPPTFSVWALDHISFAWLLFSFALAYLLLLTDYCVDRNWPLSSAVIRLACALLVAATVWLLVVPGAMSGPSGLIPSDLKAPWYDRIEELQALSQPSQWLAYLLLPITSASLLVYIAWRERSMWLLVLAVSVLIYSVLCASHIRMGAAAAMMSSLAFGIGIGRLRAFREIRNSFLPKSEQFFVAALVLVIPTQVFGAMALASLEGSVSGLSRSANKIKFCSLDPLLSFLRDYQVSTIILEPNSGPEILFKTNNKVVSGNYHHNISGLSDVLHVLGSRAPDIKAQDIVLKRNVDFVVSCNDANHKGINNVISLTDRIEADAHIMWMPLSYEVGGWHIYSRKAIRLH